MPKPPKIDAEQMGAVIDTLTTINAAMFTALATDGQIEAMHQLLDELRKGFENDQKEPTNLIRASVIETTQNALKGLQLLRKVTGQSALQ